MHEEPHRQIELERLMIRPACDRDHQYVRQLFEAGLQEGLVATNDSGADIDNLDAAYFSDEGHSGFWVAEYDGEIVGMVGVQQIADNTGEIRRLRVREDCRRCGVGTRLMEHAIGFCQNQGYLKVVLDVRIERAPAISMFEKFNFTLARQRDLEGRLMLDFYLDIYRNSRE